MAVNREEQLAPRVAGETIVRTSGLSKRFGQITAVNGLEIDVKAGRSWGFWGRTVRVGARRSE